MVVKGFRRVNRGRKIGDGGDRDVYHLCQYDSEARVGNQFSKGN